MNTGKGLKRLGIVIYIPYFTWWALVFAINIETLQECSGWFWGPFDGCSNEISWESMESASTAVIKSVFFGIVLPVLAWPTFLIGRWIYRGFKS